MNDDAFFNKIFEFDLQGKKLVFEIDQIATNSEKSILCRYGNTTILTVLCTKELTENEKLGFVPLTIFFEEKFYSVGKIPAVFNKREGKPDYNSITIARLIDRSLRSFFPSDLTKEVQITNNVLSFDTDCDPRVVSCWTSFLACYLNSQFSFFSEPLATVVVGKLNNEFICYPTIEQMKRSSFELVITASNKKIIMLELEAEEISEQDLEKAIEFARLKIQEMNSFFSQIFIKLNVRKIPLLKSEKKIEEELSKDITKELENILGNESDWEQKQKAIENNFLDRQKKNLSYSKYQIEEVYYNILRELIKNKLSNAKKRIDGRKIDDIRPLTIKIDYLPGVHGSALFTRGQTQVLSVITLGKSSEKQLIDNIFVRSYKHFIHHYNFPSFAVNETINFRNISRREIGHGQLVEKTFPSLLPSLDDFPYTIRAVSEVLSSNGSSSQAAICATSLALMVAGVPLKKPAAGIALGLIGEKILVDINALEDRLGEMDFKIAGTEEGICSLQLDVKSDGLSFHLLKECLEKGKKARLSLLNEMNKYIQKPRSQLVSHAIKFRRLFVGTNKLSLVVGVRGKNINYLIEEIGVNVDLQPEGYVLIYHLKEEQLKKAVRFIQELTKFKN